MGKEIQSIICDEIEAQHDLYKKLELVTIALREQIEHTTRLEQIISRQGESINAAAELGSVTVQFMGTTTEKIQDIYKILSGNKYSGGSPGATNEDVIILKKNISLLQENLQEVYELIINMK